MSHGYVRNHYGDNCHFSDSSYKRYNRYHYERCGCDSLSTYLAGSGCCHSHSSGCGGGMNLFWPNFVSGLCQSVLGMFGGFGGGWGFGMPSFGGWGFGGGWGLGAGWLGTNQADGVDGASRRAARARRYATNGATGTVQDIDNPKIAALTKERAELVARGNALTQAQVEAFNKKLDDAIAATDNIAKESDVKTYKNLKLTLPEPQQKDLTKIIKLGGADVSVENIPDDMITLDNIKGLTPDDIQKLNEAQAKNILTKLGYIDNNSVGKMSGEYNILLLLQKSGVNVQCATNPKSEDKMIQGKISNVVQTDGKISYTIDNGTADGIFKYKYTFQQVDDKNGKKCFHLTKIENNNSDKQGYVDNNWKNRDYICQNEKEPLKITGIPLISTRSSSDRTKLETELK
ncbi:MAG: hypothetical protein E7Z92_03170 [Cyanobacteria bacterium SIG31]|nr:hypothetical protein [Cyanobacteria bacterium SIG31]